MASVTVSAAKSGAHFLHTGGLGGSLSFCLESGNGLFPGQRTRILTPRPLVLRSTRSEPTITATSSSSPSSFSPASSSSSPSSRRPVRPSAVASPSSLTSPDAATGGGGDDQQYDAIVIGSGMGGLTTASQLAAKGAKVLLLEKYIIPGGSAGFFEREGYRFDVGSSMMFGFGDKGTTNLLTRALAAVDVRMETVPDPAQIHYHLPKGLEVRVHRDYEQFIAELTERFPHEKEGIRKFYDACWSVFNSLNSLELKSLEEPRYLLGEFARNPLACLTLAWFLPVNAGDIARKHIKDQDLLYFIDMECFCWSTVRADLTPMINAGMVFCDRHYGGVNYPIGGVGRIAELMAEGYVAKGGDLKYKANVNRIIVENGKAVGVELNDGRKFYGKTVISNATRWDTFEKLLRKEEMPEDEKEFQGRYKKSPSFLSVHMGIDASILSPEMDCHHIVLEDWSKLEDAYGTLFVSIPTLLDPSLAPPGKHIFHAFTPAWIDDFAGLSSEEYVKKKEAAADQMIARLEAACFPGLSAATSYREVGTPRTHRRFLARDDGTYGPIPSRRPVGLLGMPFNTTSVPGLYCVGDSCFPGQGVNAVAFSGIACAHRVAADLGLEKRIPVVDEAFISLLRAARGSV